MSWLFLLILALLGPWRGDAVREASYGARIVLPEERREFYRDGGRSMVGRVVHLHVERTVFARPPRRLPTSRKGEYLVFENRTVPLVVYSRNTSWVQVSRHLNDAGEFCLRGVLRIPDHDPRRRVHLVVEKIRRAPGTWSYHSDR